jgi:hypothetical protein
VTIDRKNWDWGKGFPLSKKENSTLRQILTKWKKIIDEVINRYLEGEGELPSEKELKFLVNNIIGKTRTYDLEDLKFSSDFEDFESTTRSYVYFLVDEKYEFCKIGFSSNYEQRTKKIQSHCPLRLSIHKLIPGGITKEKELHYKFEEYRVHGEWFKLTGKLLDFLC